MFRDVGRRLALLNAVVVILVIALAGAATFVLLRRSLDDEINSGLKERVEVVRDHPAQWGVPSRDDDDDDDAERDREIVESGDTIVFVVGPDGAILSNTRGVELAGLPVESAIARALAGKRDTRTVTIEGVRMRVMTAPIRDHDEVTGVVQAARSLREHEAELALVGWMTLVGVGLGALVAVPAGLLLARRAMRPIDAAFQRQRAFVADASHELRTPLTLVRANAELTLLDPDRPVAEAAPALQSILAEVDRTDRLVDDLLLLARTDAGQLALDLAPADPGAIVAAAAESMRPLFDARGVALRVSHDPAPPLPLDRERILQLARILLDNALTHTPPGGTVELRAGPARAGHGATIVVQDSGAGIAPEHLPRVFERFYRADPSRTRGAGGTGLGLPIARAIVEAHGGQIAITSQPGEGTTVTVGIGDGGRGTRDRGRGTGDGGRGTGDGRNVFVGTGPRPVRARRRSPSSVARWSRRAATCPRPQAPTPAPTSRYRTPASNRRMPDRRHSCSLHGPASSGARPAGCDSPTPSMASPRLPAILRSAPRPNCPVILSSRP